MFHRLRRAGLLVGTVCAALVVPGVANADPLTPRSDTFELVCGGETYEVVVAGNGLFTPAHDVDSTTVFVPTTFGETHITVRTAGSGEVIGEFTDPAVWKGRATKDRGTSASCTYSFVFEFYDEELGELLLVTVNGSVEGFSTPART